MACFVVFDHTIGVLIDVWTAVYYFAFVRGHLDENNSTWFWVIGLFLTGVTLIVLGLVLGPLGRAARKAELPPVEATAAEAQVQQTAAATPAPILAPTVSPAVAQPTVPAPTTPPSAMPVPTPASGS